MVLRPNVWLADLWSEAGSGANLPKPCEAGSGADPPEQGEVAGSGAR
jgi:hypothetical protein